MPEDVLTAPAADTAAPDVSDFDADTGGDVDAGMDSGQDAGIDVTAGEEPAPEPGRLVVDGKLSVETKAALEALKADPKNAPLVKALTRDAFLAERFRKEGGIHELQRLRGIEEELGGADGIQESQQELDGWRGFDEMWTSADPKVLDFLMETPEAKATFLKIAPMAFDRYRDTHPQGFNNYVSRVFTADMQAYQIPLLLERLGDFLPADNSRAKAIWEELATYVNRLDKLALTAPVAPAAPAAPASGPDADRQQFEQERANFTRQTWQQDANQYIHNRLFNDAWKKHIGYRKISPQQQTSILKYYRTELQEELGKKKGFNDTLSRFLKNNQKDGFMRQFQATYAESVPLALRRTLAAFGIGKPGSKPGGTTPANGPTPKGAVKTPVGKPQSAAFVPVNAKPDMGTVNRRATTAEMWHAKQAVLNDGKRVYWK